MSDSRITRVGWIAIGIALVGGLVALFNVWSDYQKSGAIDWGHLALAIGVPLMIYVIVKSSATRKP